MYESTIHYSGKSEIGYPQKSGRRGRKRQTGGENGSLRRFCRIFAGAGRPAASSPSPKGKPKTAQTMPPLCKGRCHAQHDGGIVTEQRNNPSGVFHASSPCTGEPKERTKRHASSRSHRIVRCRSNQAFPHWGRLGLRADASFRVKTPPHRGGVFCAFVYLPSSSPGSFAISPAPIVRMRSPARAFARR